VNTKLGVKSLDELAAYSKQKAGTLSYSAPSSSLVYFMENWKKKTGADLVRVPFKGGGDTVTNMLSGVTPVGFLGLGNFLSYIRAGTIAPIMVDADKRVGFIPNVPTLGEMGFARDHTRAFFGLLAPAGTPKVITERVRKEIIAIAREPDFMKRRLVDRGLEPVLDTPDEFRDYLVADRVRAQHIVKVSGLGPK
jgi:tripartite-type tricarboxylate transporter receptor subunit TctC